jgi:hypothetical protein
MGPRNFFFGTIQRAASPRAVVVGDLKRCDLFELPERRKGYAYPDRL